mmetsp:Transcript_26204/g.53400  ORF Transcript_26204/g.53400 Transcript_26204/m.53400 type:complete len:355 (+) Transcript_26204:45-1109(+)
MGIGDVPSETIEGTDKMGCGQSKSVQVAVAQKFEPVVCSPIGTTFDNGLKPESAEQRKHRLVLDSWTLVEMDIEALAVNWFLMVFKMVPSALELFHFKDDTDLKNSKWLRVHAVMNWRMIGRVAKSIQNPQLVFDELHSVAKAHTAFSLNSQVFDIIGRLFLTVLEEGLGPKVWNDELKDAWKEIFDLIAKEMLIGIEEAKPTVLEGDCPEARRQQLVVEDFAKLETDLLGNGAKLVLRLIDIAPECLEFFQFRNTPAAELPENKELRGHGRLILRTFGRVVKNQKDLSLVSSEMLAVAKAHTMVRIKRPELFEKIGEALMWLLENEIVKERWDEEHRQGWDVVVRFMAEEMGE